jgi:uncharacterized membrane protein
MEDEMDSVLISMVVTAGFFMVTATLGFRLGRSAKPYGVVKLAAHIFLFLLVLSGVIASAYKLNGFTGDKLYSTIAIYVAGLTLLSNFTIGICMAVVKKKSRELILAHKLSTLIMAVSILAGIIFLAMKI